MNTIEKAHIRIPLILVIASLIASHICFWTLPDVFESWNLRAVDHLFSIRANNEKFRPHYDDTIVHVDLNNSSIQQLGDFYLNRSHHAQVIRNLSAMGVAIQMYDFIFSAPSDDAKDNTLIRAVSEAGNVYFGLAFVLAGENHPQRKNLYAQNTAVYLNQTRWNVSADADPSHFFTGVAPLITFPALARASKGLGFLNLTYDPDGIFRRVPLIVRYQNAYYPSFPFRAICDYLGVPPEKVIIGPGKSITMKDAIHPQSAQRYDIVIPVDRHGALRVNFIGPWERMKHYNFSDILKASESQDELEMWKEELSGKIVVVSEVTTGSSDIGSVPADPWFPLSGLHANVMHAILTKSFLRELSTVEMLGIELLLIFGIFIFSIRFSAVTFSIGTVVLCICYVGVAAYFFLYSQVIFHIVRPLLAAIMAIASILIYRYIYEEKKKEVLRRSFEAYFPPPIVKKLITNPKMIAEKGEKKELTILFSDIKNFTAYSSTLTPGRVQKLLNEYFETMTDIVFKHGGTIDKFIGDGLMVFFGDPEPQPDHALRCVQAAVEMQKRVKLLRRQWEERGDFPLQIRIGINTGQVAVGNMGSYRRLAYTVLGANVNLAERLESNAPVDGIMISEKTKSLIEKYVDAGDSKQINVKGYDEPVTVYELTNF